MDKQILSRYKDKRCQVKAKVIRRTITGMKTKTGTIHKAAILEVEVREVNGHPTFFKAHIPYKTRVARMDVEKNDEISFSGYLRTNGGIHFAYVQVEEVIKPVSMPAEPPKMVVLQSGQTFKEFMANLRTGSNADLPSAV